MLDLRHPAAPDGAPSLPLDAFTCTSSASCAAYVTEDPSSDAATPTTTALVVGVSYQ